MATQSINIAAEQRSALGSRANKRLRDSGKVPGVVYGHKEAVVPVSLPKKELVNHLNHGTHVFDLSLDGKAEKVLVKEVQYDHLGIEVLHIDFARVSADERVEVTVPLELKGEPAGESEGGVLESLGESFPSSLDGTAAPLMLSETALSADSGRTRRFSRVGGNGEPSSWVTSQSRRTEPRSSESACAPSTSLIRSITRRPDIRSSDAVGSSASSKSGKPTSDRATATRCCCPTDS